MLLIPDPSLQPQAWLGFSTLHGKHGSGIKGGCRSNMPDKGSSITAAASCKVPSAHSQLKGTQGPRMAQVSEEMQQKTGRELLLPLGIG